MLTHLDLFSGIGGFALAARMAGGYQTVGFVEIDPWCRRVLAKHWPGVPQHDDITTFTAATLAGWGYASVDIITGGFPCQDISNAGKRAGIEGAQSGLWSEYARIIGEIRPRYALVENVSALLGRGMGRVIGDLAEIGYGAEWHCIPAAAVGAPHIRDRLWIVASRQDTDPAGERCREKRKSVIFETNWFASVGAAVSDANGDRTAEQGGDEEWYVHQWQSEPDVGRVADGLPGRVDRLRGLGNAIVPQVAAPILAAIREASCA